MITGNKQNENEKYTMIATTVSTVIYIIRGYDIRQSHNDKVDCLYYFFNTSFVKTQNIWTINKEIF